MTWVAVAVAGASLVGGAISSDASRSAANKQRDAANASAGMQQQMWQQSQRNFLPYLQSGNAASQRMATLLGLSTPAAQTQATFDPQAYLAANPDVAADPYWSQRPYEHYTMHGQGEGRDFTYAPGAQGGGNQNDAGFGSLVKPFTAADYQANLDPSYGIMRDIGQSALLNSQSAQGGVLGGAALKQLLTFNQDYANTGYQNAWNRWQAQNQNTYNRLAGVANLGQSSAAGVGSNSIQAGANIGNMMTGAANAAAAGQIGQANAWGGAINNGAGYFAMSQLLNKNNGNGGGGQYLPGAFGNLDFGGSMEGR